MSRIPFPFLDPKIDVVFRALFGHRDNTDLLRSLLNGLLELDGERSIESIEHLEPIMELGSVDDKEAVFDLSVRDGRGEHYVVEMQCLNHLAFAERMLYYATRRYATQLRRGQRYHDLRPVVLVILCDFELFRTIEEYREWFELRGRSSGTVFSEQLRVVLVQLPKFTRRPEEARTLGDKWLSFLKEGSQVAEGVMQGWMTPELAKAQEELERLAGDEETRQAYELRLRQVQIWATRNHHIYSRGYQEGMDEGIEKGIEQGIEQGIEKGIEQGIEKGIEKGQLQALRAVIRATWEARFGALPPEVQQRLEATEDPTALTTWATEVATQSREEIEAQLLSEPPPAR